MDHSSSLPPFPRKAKSSASSRKKDFHGNTHFQRQGQGGFRGKVQSANQTTICSASSGVVRRLTMRQLIQKDMYTVPIFQRRYCWTETQWETLWNDVLKGGPHSMGRLTCTASSNVNDSTTANMRMTINQSSGCITARSCILDGQQRFTTTTILIAAIRDHCELLVSLRDPRNDAENQRHADAATGMISSINSLLFPDTFPLGNNCLEKQGDESASTLRFEEGMEPTFARLVPTFCDRISYYAAILATQAGGDSHGQRFASHRPMQARRYFESQLAVAFPSLDHMGKLDKFLHTLLDQFHMLYFPVTVDTGRQDGTEDMTVIYERLALRDATFCKPHRKQEYVSMDGVDMIRNLLLGSFDTEQETVKFYRDYWLPLERLAMTTIAQEEVQEMDSNQDSHALTMHVLVKKFLENEQQKHPGHKGAVKATKASVIGGQLYADFESWLHGEQSTDCTDPQSHAKSVASRMLEFAADKISCPSGKA